MLKKPLQDFIQVCAIVAQQNLYGWYLLLVLLAFAVL